MLSKLNDLITDKRGVLLTSPHNMRFFSGFSGGEGAVLVCRGAKIVITDSRYTEQAESEAKGFSVAESGNWIAYLAEAVEKCDMRELLFEDAEMRVSEYNKMKESVNSVVFSAGSELINPFRAVKSQCEIELLARAEDIACRALDRTLEIIRPGITEAEVACELEYNMRILGGEGTSFETIVVSGAKTSLPHGKPDDKKIEYGDFVTMDFGCRVGGYCSDMTRTVVVGRASEEQRRVYETVLAAQLAGLDAICAGVRGCDADSAARMVIEDAGYGKYFGHSLGHGVGLLIHELPNLSPKSEAVLRENSVVTCEPGIYIPGFGGVRIEDMVCVKEKGYINFTHYTKELLEL